ncbi:peptide ABC transporter ATP-binding protein [Malaciobacter molluscorum]|uniref:ABC transporter ATP-binding protein n=1 Tax=Malaciobacter molluscorum TaxID=1032072 RepID=UPI00100A298E|nr:dipeptide/oligopeptide/nickel ABC transporter ATP-binding protein [Malaciobacter molluscorum]RXJ94630.1 peptide ABC transporter ATP-binding protein [Malaciobacter molluscorum]
MLKIKNLTKTYNKIDVLKDINIDLKSNESIAIVGESGSGKSTLAKLILKLEKPTKGKIVLDEKKVSIVFQDYRSSVNPIFTIKQILDESFWETSQTILNAQLEIYLKKLELDNSILEKFPHELSGGQIQRVCILRSLLSNPSFLILDEALSALDISTKVNIISLLQELKDKKGLTYFLITHDLEVATALCENIKVLYKGKIVESLKTNNLKHIKHPYTKELLDSIVLLKD